MLFRRPAILVVLAAAAVARGGLGPDDLLLVINRNVPDSAALAAHYAEVRHVPAGRVVALDLQPANEDISPADYDAKIAAPVRQFLQSPQGKNVRCVVTFYGLPLRVGQRPALETDHKELEALRNLSADLERRCSGVADQLAAIVKSIGVTPVTVNPGPDTANMRLQIFSRQLQDGMANVIDPVQKQAVEEKLQALRRLAVSEAGAALTASGLSQPALPATVDVKRLSARPHDPASRAILRTIEAQGAGAVALLQLVQTQAAWIDGQESDAAVDSELSLVLSDDYWFYRWQPNPINVHHPMTPLKGVMVCRIDAPTPQIARRIIDESAAVEATGLGGKCVIDSRGLPATPQPGTYGWFDQILRNFVVYLKANTKLDIVAEDKAQVLLPGSVRDVALYCGWYSLRQYIASCGFRPGAVAYHVASLELVSLHNPRETGWVANLLKDGVDATLGAVSEPYLSSFPRPDEFFPLLMTGRVTLAEAYWATCPMASWKVALIGDPLYRPFAAHPALLEKDLPPELRGAIEKVTATQPSGR